MSAAMSVADAVCAATAPLPAIANNSVTFSRPDDACRPLRGLEVGIR